MRFLRRAPHPADPGLAPGSPATLAVDERGVVFVDPFCPYCGTRFEPLPKRSRKCPACGGAVAYDRPEDGLVRLVKPSEKTSDRDAEAWQAARDDLFYQRNGGPLRRLNEARLRTYASLGLRVRVANSDSRTIVTAGEDRIGPGASSCGPCRDAVGTYDPLSAPVLPLERCRARPNGICVCRYEVIAPPG